MTEATAETPTEAEAREATPDEIPLERKAEEADPEASPDNRQDYSRINEKYSKKPEYKKSQKETPKKSSEKGAGSLERAVTKALADSEAIGSEHGVDPAEVLSSILARRVLYSANSDDESSKKSVHGYDERDVHDSFDGAHAIIAYKNPETGELCFSFEKKPADYPIINGQSNAGKLSLYGGSVKIGEPPNEGLSRETWEEDRNSHKIIINALNETRWKVEEVKKSIDGVPSSTHIWLAYISDPMEVRSYLSSKTLEGEKTSLSLTEMIKTKDSDFAFGFGPIVKGAGIALANRLYSQYN